VSSQKKNSPRLLGLHLSVPPASYPMGKTVVKSGENTRFAEGNTMKFVRQHTSIPVPEVYNIYKDENSGSVRTVMEYINGTQLEKAWTRITDSEEKSIIQQGRGYFKELR
jgi:hypothetical protein